MLNLRKKIENKVKEPILLSPKEAERIAYQMSTSYDQFLTSLAKLQPQVEAWKEKQKELLME